VAAAADVRRPPCELANHEPATEFTAADSRGSSNRNRKTISFREQDPAVWAKTRSVDWRESWARDHGSKPPPILRFKRSRRLQDRWSWISSLCFCWSPLSPPVVPRSFSMLYLRHHTIKLGGNNLQRLWLSKPQVAILKHDLVIYGAYFFLHYVYLSLLRGPTGSWRALAGEILPKGGQRRVPKISAVLLFNGPALVPFCVR